MGGLSQVLSARWAGLIAVLAAGTGAVAASISAPQTKEKAAGSATAYRALQQDVRIFLMVDLPAFTDEDARAKLQQLVERHQQLNRAADVPSASAWRRAKRSIEQGAQHYRVDKL